MLRFAANLSTMYHEYEFLDRFFAAARDGFTGVEYRLAYEYAATTLAGQLRENGLRLVMFNAPSGKWHEGECGLAALPGREREFRDSMLLAFEYAQVLECQNIHVLAGVPAANANREQARSIYASNLAWAAEQARLFGVEILIEPIARRSIIGYFLNRQEEAHAIVEQVAAPNLKVIMDLYHCQLEEGDLAAKIRKYLADPKQSRIGHFQIGGVPDHHEPDTGEVNYNYLFKLIDELGYEGWVGCEYRPAAGTAEGLGWLKKWKAAAL